MHTPEERDSVERSDRKEFIIKYLINKRHILLLNDNGNRITDNIEELDSILFSLIKHYSEHLDDL